ncbi:MAG: site-specific integrase [Lachnospiraceae bacterium]|nr:site-specific integrase [Lachnospiraceae bacterium]
MTKYKRQADGYFHTRVWDGTYDDKGRKHYKELRSNKSSKDLENKVQLHKEAINQGKYVVKSDVLFRDYALQWLHTYKANASYNTRRMYQNIIDKHLDVIVTPVSMLSRSCLVTVADASKGMRTRQQIVLTLKQICKCALRDKLISQATFDDIFTDTIKVKYKSPEKRALYDYEKDAIKKARFDDTEKVFVTILYYCGLRRGEAIALTRKDIDFKTNSLTVNKAVYFDDNTPVIKDTKNGVHRIVPIPNEAILTLKRYSDNLATENLFHMSDGRLMTKSSFTKMWRRIINKLNKVAKQPIEDLTPHIFRHNYCATLCGQIPTISINRIAELLGDSKQMVIEVYNHDIAPKEKVFDVINNVF